MKGRRIHLQFQIPLWIKYLWEIFTHCIIEKFKKLRNEHNDENIWKGYNTPEVICKWQDIVNKMAYKQ